MFTSTNFSLRPVLYPLVALALLSGCAVYVPTVPSTPLVTKAGETEVTVGMRSFTSGELTAAWSPASNVLVTTEGAMLRNEASATRGNETTEYVSLHKQAGVGVGTYRLLGKEKSVYVAAVGGMGFAKANMYDHKLDALGLFGLSTPVHYESNYTRYYGQVYAASLGRTVSYGASLRTTLVHYNSLKRDGQSTSTPNRLFLEPTAFIRFGRGPIQGQGMLGLSLPTTSGAHPDETRNLAPATLLLGAGIVIRPQLFKHRP